jgi:hypothetical protein
VGLFGNDRNGQPNGLSDTQAANAGSQNQPMDNGGFIATPPSSDDAAMQQSVNNILGSPFPQNTPAPAPTPDYIATPSVPDPAPTPPAPPVAQPAAPTTPDAYTPPQQPVQSVDQTAYAPPPAPQDQGDLSELKQQALQQLSPIVNHLDQSPEEKFHTTMMMLQATDDQNLIQTAFEIAQSITDDKTRAQALLDVINEINYFTQQKS